MADRPPDPGTGDDALGPDRTSVTPHHGEGVGDHCRRRDPAGCHRAAYRWRPWPSSPPTVRWPWPHLGLQRHRTCRATAMPMTPGSASSCSPRMLRPRSAGSAVAVSFALGVAGLTSQDADGPRRLPTGVDGLVRPGPIEPRLAAHRAGPVTGTTWGLFRHYWVLFKLLINLVASIVLLLYMQTLSYLAGIAAETTLSSGDLAELRGTHLPCSTPVAPCCCCLWPRLGGVQAASSMTRYGQRKQHERRRVLVP